MVKNFIKDFWDTQASNFKTDHTASWGDNFAIELEIENIALHLHEGASVLDVGCANGYSSVRQLVTNPKQITGVDVSEIMINYDNEREEDKK